MPHLNPMISHALRRRPSSQSSRASRRARVMPLATGARRQDATLRRRCSARRRLGARRGWLLRRACVELSGMRHARLKLVVGAVGESGRVLGDGAEQRLEPGMIRLGEIVQHIARHPILLPGMADADAHAHIVVADVSAQRFAARYGRRLRRRSSPAICRAPGRARHGTPRCRRDRAYRSARPRRRRGPTRS